MELADCAVRVGSTYVLQTAGQAFDAILDSCQEGPDGAFSLEFRAGPGAPAVQGVFLLGPSEAEMEPVFLVPCARDADGVTYCAVFSVRGAPVP